MLVGPANRKNSYGRDRIFNMAHPFIPFANCCKLEMVHLQFGQYVENVYHFRRTEGAIGTEDMATLAAFMKGWFTSNHAPLINNDVSLVLIRAKDLTTQFSPGIEYSTGLPAAGVGTGHSEPSNVTLAVKLSTGLSGRSYRGRVYFIGLPAGAATADQVDGVTVAAIKSAWQNLQSTLPAGWEWVVASSMENLTWRTTGVMTTITGIAVDPFVDSQRRRLVGRGR